ncbi:MAG: bacillithiol biosynthesis cysteine-adding enzyme BshC [Candidatus Omnitrophota bacterium]
MEILTAWNAASLTGVHPYAQALANPPAELLDLTPPPLSSISSVIEKRKPFIGASIDRDQLADSLRQSHERRDAPASALRAIERLREEDCYLIIAGQQPGLLGGPLYTFYKILHAIHLSRRLSAETQKTFLPAFWNATEDDDISEIASLYWLSKEKTLAAYHWGLDKENRRPYFSISKNELPINDLLDCLRGSLHPTEFVDTILDKIRSCYDRSDSYPDFFDRLIWMLFPNEGLIIVRPDDPYIRRESRRILEREIAEPAHAAQCVEEAGARLQVQGLTPPIHKRADRTSFFLVEEGRRWPLFVRDGEFETTNGKRWSRAELLRKLDEQPEAFSASAVLRPAIQDALLPTMAAILGPNELAYHFLLKDIYAQHGVPRPCLERRFGFTLLEGREKKLLERYGLEPNDLAQHPAALAKRIAQQESGRERDAMRRAAEKALIEYFQTLEERARQTDPTILKTLEKNHRRIQQEIENSENLVSRREAEKNQTLLLQLQSLQCALLPEGDLQERRLNIFYYLLKYGPSFLTDIQKISEAAEEGAHCFISAV